ncbi:hypothetical protein GCM10027284_09630 [Cyclobacterium sediminis]
MIVTVNKKLRHENVPCTSAYFETNIKSQPLRVVYQNNDYYRVRDIRNEEWGFFESQLDLQAATKTKNIQASVLPGQQTKG